MRNLSQLKTDNLNLFFKQNDNILTAYIFGSFGTHSQTPMSDIDIAVLYNTRIPLMEELRISAEISSILGRDGVDVINLNTVPVYMQHQVLYTGEKLYERDFEKTADFVESVLEEYHDYGIILKKYRDDYHQSLVEEYVNG